VPAWEQCAIKLSNDIQFVAVYTTNTQSIHVNATVSGVIQQQRRLSSSALLVRIMLRDEDQRPNHHQTKNLLGAVTGMILVTLAVATVPIQGAVEIDDIFLNLCRLDQRY
jgi:hypothetical protein